MLTDEQSQRLVDFVTAEISAGRMTEAQGREYVAQTLQDANRLTSVMDGTPPTVDHAASFVPPDDTRIAVTLLAEQGLSRAQIAARLQGSGLDGLGEAIAQRKASLLKHHVETQAALAADAPDARRAAAQEQIRAAEALSRDARLAREYLTSEGVLPADVADELTDAEAIATAFSDRSDPDANDLAANLARASAPRPKQFLDGDDQ